MPNRRILSIWFPRLAAERLIRLEPLLDEGAFAVVRDSGQTQVIGAVNAAASAAGLHPGQSLRDARALCAELRTLLSNPQAEEAFLEALERWAGKFSPWVAATPPASLLADITGCAHLFGGEAGLMARLEADCDDLGLTVQAGIADTVGAAWALARYAGQPARPARSGDDIDQEALATRSRAAKRRHWERGGAAPQAAASRGRVPRIAPPGQMRQALAPLPAAALRLPQPVTAQLARLGLRRIDELVGQPRATLARRFGKELVLRLDQAMGTAPEPLSPARAPEGFSVRLTLPEPIGLMADLVAGFDRLLPPLCAKLAGKGRGARGLRLQALRCDHTMQVVTVGLARPSATPDRLRPLMVMKLEEIDAGPGIDTLRLEAYQTEPLQEHQHKSQLPAPAKSGSTPAPPAAQCTDMDDLIGRIGARVGLEHITRLHPGESHIPEKAAQVLAAAWSAPSTRWPRRPAIPRPLVLHPPEMVREAGGGRASAEGALPLMFHWRRRPYTVARATGPERIAPEWWLDEPGWRNGTRDYWRVTTQEGAVLWLYYAHGGALSAGWFCQGAFA
ncbi:DNA polymerase Y family protein [Alphaproteobacteria bacterium KMM 3653]|uniref:DNA polymerase Y family protein n=1 Tax=Harenicola maris TaxID=2841044 RepID=A0AAP2CPS5_9RHOB|nr:DNA polymerase Y family protein [Harenicola maris]